MLKKNALIYLFGMRDVNANIKIFNDMQMIHNNEVNYKSRWTGIKGSELVSPMTKWSGAICAAQPWVN